MHYVCVCVVFVCSLKKNVCALFVSSCVMMYGLRWFVCIGVCLFVCMCVLFVIYCVMLYGVFLWVFVPVCGSCVSVLVWFVCDSMCDVVWFVSAFAL